MPYTLESIFSKDGPEHTRLRRQAAPAFTARRIGELRPYVRERVARLLAEMKAAGPPADLMTGLALPLSLSVLCRLIGAPYEHRERFQRWVSGGLANEVSPLRVRHARARVQLYVTELVESRRAEHGDDLLGLLVRARDEGGLSDEELRSFGATLLMAGYETTAGGLCTAALLLLRDPGQLHAVRRRPDLLPGSVDEALRRQAVLPRATPRVAVADLRLGNTDVRTGELVSVDIQRADHDPRRFAEPAHLQVTRPRNRHLAFGFGAKYCLGAALARMEMVEALAGLFHTFPTLRLAVPHHELTWRPHSLLHILDRLPVTWEAA